MFDLGFGWGMGSGFLSMIGGMLFFAMWFVCFVVAVAVIFLLVRFLLIGTRAAQIYVAQNEPARPVAPPATTAPKVATPAAPESSSSAPKAAGYVPADKAPASKSAATHVAAAKDTPKADPASATQKQTVTKPAAAKKTPAKPAANTPRTPAAPKSTKSKGAPKKP